eukprot:gene4015-5018_t
MSTTTTKQLTICTHSGSFHADEALACFLLKQTEKYKDAKIIRSRDMKIINEADIVVDVGAEYDAEKNRFDHHQAGFTTTFDDKHETKLSSAGLIYKHFGREIIKSRLNLNDECTELIYHKVYDNFIEELDGIDNGIERYPSDIKPKYVSSSGISARVGYLNPNWNEPQTDEIYQTRFNKAVEFMGEAFLDRIDYYGKSWLPARTIVENAVRFRKDAHSSGEIIILEHFCPWKDHLYSIEKELGLKTPIKFALFGDVSGTWRVQAVNVSSHSFELRLALPAEWRGKRDEELSKIIGIEDCVFTHANGFIGGHKNKDGALIMAVKALATQPKQ